MTNSGQFEEVCLCNSKIKTGWTTENGIPLCNICGKVDVKACVEMAGESWHARAELPKVPEGMAIVPVADLEVIVEVVRGMLYTAYNNAMPVCCGKPGQQCCGNPDPEWNAEDMKVMDSLGPIEKMISAMLAAAKEPQCPK